MGQIITTEYKILAYMALSFAIVACLMSSVVESEQTNSVSDKTGDECTTSTTVAYKTTTNDKFSDAAGTTTDTIASTTKTSITKTTKEAAVSKETVRTDKKESIKAIHYSKQDAIDIAKVLYHECRGVSSKTEQACVVWVILNRVDYYNSTVHSVVRTPNQFAFYENTPVWDELLSLAYDVLSRWSQEINGKKNVGRVLPKDYIYFEGRSGHNYFRNSYSDTHNVWEYTLDSPYDN